MEQPPTLPIVYKYSVLKRVALSLVFVLMAALAGSVPFYGEDLTTTESVLGVVFGLLMAAGAVMLLLAPWTALIVDWEGIDVQAVQKKYRRRIRWEEIERIEVATQSMSKGGSQKYIALSLSGDADFGVHSGGGMQQALAGGSMSDGGVADLYISGSLLRVPTEKVVETLVSVWKQKVPVITQSHA